MKINRSKKTLRKAKEGASMGLARAGLCLFISALMLGPSGWAETKVSGEVEAGYQRRDLSTSEAKFQEYGETLDGVVIPRFKVQSVGDHDTVSLEGSNVRQNNQSYDLNYNRNYQTKVDAFWNQTPHDYSNVGQTLYNEVSPGVFRLPAQIQSNLQAQQTPGATGSIPVATFNTQMASYMQAARPAELQVIDNKGGVNAAFAVGPHMKWNLGISEDRYDGHKPWGASFGFSHAVELPAPVKWQIYKIQAGSQYATKDVQVGLNYAMSSFNNEAEKLIWDNAKRASDRAASTSGYVSGDQSSQGRSSLPPDNVAHTIALNVGTNLPAHTRFTASGSMSYFRQNQQLDPWTINSAIKAGAVGVPSGPTFDASDPANLPESRANAKMLTWTQDFKLTNRVVKPLTFGVHYRSYQLVNQISEVDFPGQVRLDQVWEGGTLTPDRFEFRKDLIEGSADYEVFQPLTVGLKYGTQWDHRTHRETTDTTEKTLTAFTDIKPTRSTLVRATYIRAHRRPQDFATDEFLTPGTTNFSELPGLRRYDVADRLRNQGNILLQVVPGPVTVSVNASLTHDNYQPGVGDLTGGITGTSAGVQQAQQYGMLESRDSAAGIDVGFDITDRLAFAAYYNFEQTEAIERSNQNDIPSSSPVAAQDPTTDWTLRALDRYHVAGVSADVGAPADRVGVRLGYDVIYSRGSDNYQNVGSGVVPQAPAPAVAGLVISPPDTKWMKQDISLRTNVRVNDRCSVILGYLFEKFDVSDWQLQNIPLVGGTGLNQTNILLGTNLQNYIAHVGTVLVKYKF